MTKFMTLAVVALLFAGGVCADDPPKKDKDPPKKLTDAERKELEKEWKRLIESGETAYVSGKLPDAVESLQQALGIARQLYPVDSFPDGHDNLIFTLIGLAGLHAKSENWREAASLFRESLDMQQRLYPKKDSETKAGTMNALGFALASDGKVYDAEILYRDSLEMYSRVLKVDDHPVLALGLNNLAYVLSKQGKLFDSCRYHARALRMRLRIWKGQDNEDVAQSLNNLGMVFHQLGKEQDAEELIRMSLGMRLRLRKGVDHSTVSMSLGNLSLILQSRGQLVQAEVYAQGALEMNRRLHPKQDHSSVALNLNNLALLFLAQARFEEAESTARESLTMRERLYPKQDHSALVESLDTLSSILFYRGNQKEFIELSKQALEMWSRLHRTQAHPHLARLTANHGVRLWSCGRIAEATPHYTTALEVYLKCYQKEDHFDIVCSLGNLAALHECTGDFKTALPLNRDAMRMTTRLLLAAANQLSEGDLLTYASCLPKYQDAFLSNALASGEAANKSYAEIFLGRSLISRHTSLMRSGVRASGNQKATQLLAELAETRGRRAELLFAPQTKDEAALDKREQEIRGYEKVIAEKDKELRKLVPAVERLDKLNKATPADLQKVLPADVAVVDYLRWVHFEYDPKKPGKDGEKRTVKYLAFVVTKADVRWVHLDTAANIEPAVAAWREAITGDPVKKVSPLSTEKTAELGAKVRELVWAKVRKELPAGIKTVYVCPDRDLCRLPWAALPGDKPGTILLEDYAISTIPHAPFLLDRLWPQEERKNPPTVALAVGGVKYDAELPAPSKPEVVSSSRRGEPLIDEKKKPTWVSLPATAGEAEWFTKSAEKKRWPVESLSGEKATPAALLAALPKARYAHLATHGFFADKQFRSAFDLDERDYQMMRFGERVGRAANNPLVMTGLVLAGANHPKTPNRGIVTGESLIDLDLSGLELVVLSACETGLGDDVTAGEGTFGLQRAFHYAGARDVVASLWKVDDIATAALMGEFYRQLWEQNQPPVEALRQAQLAVYRADAKRFAELARRGFETGDKDLSKLPVAKDGKGGSHPSLWAAFTVSGYGK